MRLPRWHRDRVTRSRWLRSVAALALLVGLCGATFDDTRSALPPLAPRAPVAKGRTLFADDFSSSRLVGWKTDQPKVWSVVRGMLRADLPDHKQLRALLMAGDSTWTNVAIDLDVCMMRGVDKGVVVRVLDGKGLGIDLRGGEYQDLVVYQGALPIGRAAAINGNGTWNHLRVELRGTHFKIVVNGDTLLEREGRLYLTERGGIALPAYTGGSGQCTVYYDNVVVTALD